MDLSAILGTVMSNDSVSGLSQAAGVSNDEVKNVLSAALPSLMNGALAQSEGSDTSAGFAGALAQHAADNTGDLSAFLSNVDMKDGSKIVAHLLGSNTDATVAEISEKTGVSAANTGSVLSAAAPLLMSLLGQETSSQQQNSSAGVSTIMSALLSNVDMGSLLMGLLGSSTATTAAPAVTEAKPKDEKQSNGLLGLLGGLFK